MSKRQPSERKLSARRAEIVREYGPFHAGERVHGVSYDGEKVWFATGEKLRTLSPEDGRLAGALDVACDAGTAFDGEYLYQLADGRIHKIDPHTGQTLRSLASPGEGRDAGLTWAEGRLWVAKYDSRKIHQIDPETGAILRTIESNRVVTGVTWVDGELWHGTWEGEASDVRRIDPQTGEVLETLDMPAGMGVSGLESDGGDRLFCGGGTSGKVRVVRRPARGAAVTTKK
jgi:glutamine cyclotransferase